MCSTTFGQDANSLAWSGRSLTAEEAEALENRIKQNPTDVASRTLLLGYYSAQQFQDESARRAKRRHVLWLIVNSPESEVLGTPYGELDAHLDAQAYAQGKRAWIEHLKRRPDDLKLLEHSAHYFLQHDRELSRESLEKARSVDQDNPKWPAELGRLYLLDMNSDSLKVKTDAAGKALEQYEIAYELSTDRRRTALLRSLAKAAFEANQPHKAREYAEEMLRQPGHNGNNSHFGNVVLGRLALKEGHLEEAKQRLIQAGQTSGSPNLNSFGPNMALAKELLQQGETVVVLEYFELCSKFWKSDRGRLAEWSDAVREGKIPDFGPNLCY
jgi:hypothetical protein